MPYIKPKLREKYDPIVEALLLKIAIGVEDTSPEENQLLRTLQAVELESQDGELNYFVTRLFKRAGWLKKYKGYYDTYESNEGSAIRVILKKVITKFYLPEKYFLYNRGTGTIVNIADEFTRRYGDEAQCIVLLLNDVKKFFDERKGTYEDKKKAENGDVLE